ncbi:cobalamin-binding protein [Pseudoalteromonas piscicida]|uniref:cobalamin-binding protein n=1 Tax=Pseudoalteromonas piscicida TaxID=43662 RepID=UPI0030AE4A9D
MKKIALFMLLGCTLSLQAKPAERIIALAPHIVENLYAIGAGDRIVGTVAYADYPQAAKQIPQIGGYHGIQLEKVLALEPDLVIAWQTGNKKADLEKLEQLGIQVVYSETKAIEKVADELIKFGQLTGLEAPAREKAQRFTQRLTGLQKQYAQSSSIKVFYQLWPAPLITVGGNSWVQQVLEICHADNVFADSTTDYPQISIENVLLKSPEVMVIPNEKTEQDIKPIDWHKWPSIPAVKHQQSISVDADLLHRYSYRMLEGIADLCGKLDSSRAYYKTMKRVKHDNVE